VTSKTTSWNIFRVQ